MKIHSQLSLLALGAALSTGTMAQAQTLLSVDIGNSGTAPSGFQIFDPTSANNNVGLPLNSADFGSIHVTLSAASIANENNAPALDSNGDLANWGNGIITRNRSTISTTDYGPMYQDFATAASGGAVGLEISGLLANTAYSITFFSYDHNGSRTSTFTDYTGGNNTTLGSITYSGDPTTEYQYSLTSIVTTDSSGRLIFAETEPGNAPVLNGFEIAAVPEPTSMSLIGGGLLATWLIRRQRGQASAK